MYAIVDLETTGGRPDTDRIIEIAVYLHDGKKITEEYSSLIDPGVAIPPFISRLTNITDQMVSKAPDFSAVAPRIAELLQERVFVAHNVQFDYSFLKHSLEREGFSFENKQFCTCKSSRRLIPGFPSYSLGKLCQSLSIQLQNAHRAAADALATTRILELLIEKTQGNLEPFYYQHEPKLNVSRIPNEEVEKLPNRSGVLYFLNEEKEVIYLLKSKNIRKKAWSVIGKFKNKRFASVASLATSIDYVVTGSQLLASIKEAEEIAALQPRFNRKQKALESRYSIYEKLTDTGNLILETGLLDKTRKPVVTFNSQDEANKVLLYTLKESGIDLTRKVRDEEEYNSRMNEVLEKLKLKRKNFLVTDTGPEPGTTSVVVIQNGLYSGYFLTEAGQTVETVDIILERVIKADDHPLTFKNIVQHVSKGYYKEIIHF